MKNGLKKRKCIVSAILVGTMIFSLAGCGKSTKADEKNTESQKVEESENTDKNGFENNTPLSEAFKTDAIWYYLDDDKMVGKDTYILDVVIVRDGKIEVCNVYNDGYGDLIKLGDIAKLSDEEIIDKFEQYKQKMWDQETEQACKVRDLYQKIIDIGMLDHPVTEYNTNQGQNVTYDFTPIKDSIVEAVEKMKEFKCPETMPTSVFHAYTDQTGTLVEKEEVTFEGLASLKEESIGEGTPLINYSKGMDNYDSIMERLGKFNADAVNPGGNGAEICTWLMRAEERGDMVAVPDYYKFLYYTPSTESKCTFTITGTPVLNVGPNGAYQVYDSEYSGYLCKNNYLLTRTDGRIDFTMDKTDTKGINLD